MGVSLFAMTLYFWAGLTAVLLVLLLYRTLIGMHEENQIFLDRAEAALEQEQLDVMRKLKRIDPILKGLAILSGSLILILGIIWLYRSLSAAAVL
jgi:hypothetical protein